MNANRRDILFGAAGAALALPTLSFAQPAQRFKVGIVPRASKAEAEFNARLAAEQAVAAATAKANRPLTAEERQLALDAQAGGQSAAVANLTPDQRADRFWLRCDDIAALGFHRIETDDTFTQAGTYFSTRQEAFREGLAKRNLTVNTLTFFVQMTDPAKVPDITAACLRSARTLQAGKGKYVGILVSAGPNIGYATEADYQAVDIKALGRTMTEIARKVHGETGIKLLYHPLSEEFNVDLPLRLLQETDPRLVDATMDLGHMGSSKLGASREAMLGACRAFYSRTTTVHIKDCKRPGRHGNVEFGKGDLDLKGIVDWYRGQGFRGDMMAEGGGSNEFSRQYLTDTLGLSLA